MSTATVSVWDDLVGQEPASRCFGRPRRGAG